MASYQAPNAIVGFGFVNGSTGNFTGTPGIVARKKPATVGVYIVSIDGFKPAQTVALVQVIGTQTPCATTIAGTPTGIGIEVTDVAGAQVDPAGLFLLLLQVG